MQKNVGIGYRRQTGAAAAEHGPGGCAFRSGHAQQGLGESRRKSIRGKLRRRETDDCLVDREAGERGGFKTVSSGVSVGAIADDNDLDWIEQQPLEREAVTACVEAEVLNDAGEGFKGVFGYFAIFCPARERFKTQERGGGGGISGRRWRILQRLAPSAKRAKNAVHRPMARRHRRKLPQCDRRSGRSWHRRV